MLHLSPTEWGELNVGQNLAWSTRTRNWEWAVTAWHAEVSLFRYGGNNDYGVVGHYTQVNLRAIHVV